MNDRNAVFAAEQALRGDWLGWLHDKSEEEGDCLIWQGQCAEKGARPKTRLPKALPHQPGRQGRFVLVRRVIWECMNGKSLPDNHKVWVKCMNPLCVAPDHLCSGTAKQFMRFMASQGLLKHTPTTKRKLEVIARTQSPLTWEAVHYIRDEMSKVQRAKFIKTGMHTGELVKPSGITRIERMRQLAEQFGVDPKSIQKVIAGKSWNAPSEAANNPFAQLLKLAA